MLKPWAVHLSRTLHSALHIITLLHLLCTLVRETFQRAREGAPSVLFLDEIDALVGRRGSDLGMPRCARRTSLMRTCLTFRQSCLFITLLHPSVMFSLPRLHFTGSAGVSERILSTLLNEMDGVVEAGQVICVVCVRVGGDGPATA
jgi:SpoVK/Ycf46/Vps4 family AAA+-type ATPase